MNTNDTIDISASLKTNTTASADTNKNFSMLFIIIYIAPCPIVLCIHSLALTLLKRDRNFTGSQKYILRGLCWTEIVLSTQMTLRGIRGYYHNIILNVEILSGETAGTLMYFFVMTFLTLDRLAAVKLNLKYPIYCKAKRTIAGLIITFIISLLLFAGLLITFFVYKNPDKSRLKKWNMFLFAYIVTVLQGIFLIITSITYFYIFKKLRKNRLALRKITKQLHKNSMRKLQSKKTQTNPKLFVPGLIILTFILFSIFPHFMYFGYSKMSHRVRTFFEWIPVLFSLGWCVDPIIYIFSNRSVQKKIKQCIMSPK